MPGAPLAFLYIYEGNIYAPLPDRRRIPRPATDGHHRGGARWTEDFRRDYRCRSGPPPGGVRPRRPDADREGPGTDSVRGPVGRDHWLTRDPLRGEP